LGIEFKENDVEAPEIFNAEGLAFWDGQSSLGGVWISRPGVKQPTRVIIKDKYNGKSVIGAIFNRSGNPAEKRMLLSSEAAVSLGIAANENRIVSVTALRALKTTNSVKKRSKKQATNNYVVALESKGNVNHSSQNCKVYP
jgi:hypothetical protein